MIKVSHLSKRIGEVQALNDLSFVAENGQITGLLGPNGAGKTTCLRTIFGLLKPDTGTAEIEGIDVAIDPIGAKQQLGLFPDPFGLYERLTPREYIRYFAELSGLSASDAKEATSKVIAKLRLEDISDRRCKGFSQGQRMKTALAQAIVHSPSNIILDEPTRGVDVGAKKEIYQLINQFKKEGMSIILVSSEMPEVLGMSDRIMVMHEGRISAEFNTRDANQEKLMAAAVGKQWQAEQEASQ